jgi:hypothetical protein
MITLRQITVNMSKGQSAISVRHIVNAYENIYQSMKPQITILSSQKQGDQTLVYVSIPSQSEASKKYLIVIKIDSLDRMTMDTKLKVYSNSPVFLYNFTYVFYKSDALLFPNKYPSEFKTIAPGMRNPYATVGFDKQIFAAIRYIADNKLKNISSAYGSTMPPAVPNIRLKLNRQTGKTELITN